MKYQHKFLIAGGPAEGPQLPNVFHFYGTRIYNEKLEIGLIQQGATAPDPIWLGVPTFQELFEPIA